MGGKVLKGVKNVAADTPGTHMRSLPPPPASCGSADPIAAAERLLRWCSEAARPVMRPSLIRTPPRPGTEPIWDEGSPGRSMLYLQGAAEGHGASPSAADLIISR